MVWTSASPEYGGLSGRQVGVVMLSPDLWNLSPETPADAGALAIRYDGGVVTTIRFRQIMTNDITTAVIGYPDAHYGHDVRTAAHTTTAPATGPLPLPAAASRVPAFIAVADYAVEPIGSGALPPMDLSFDMWVTADRWHGRGNQICAGTKFVGIIPRCTPDPTIVEVMVWLYQHDLAPTGPVRERFAVPAWTRDAARRTWTPASTMWNAYVDAHKFAVSFALDRPAPAAAIGIALPRFMNEALRLLGKEPGRYYLESIDLGSEFATRGGRSTVSATAVQLEQRLMRALGVAFSRTQAQYTWRLSRYCFVFGGGAPHGCDP